MDLLPIYTLFTLIILYLLVKIGLIKSEEIRRVLDKWLGSNDAEDFFTSNTNNDTEEDHTTRDYYVYNGSNLAFLHQDVINILNKHYPYYSNLSLPLKQIFYDRLCRFMNQKQFIIHSQQPYKEMPILISAAAVQISFGLENFELNHYNYIQIHKEEYFAENSLHVLAGNVQGNCITLAWNQFLKGYDNMEDGNNVGLHEMAHALYFQEMMVDNHTDFFDTQFNQLMDNGEGVLKQTQCPYNLYTNYAFTNLQEFWAVSVELFFEKGNDLSLYYPKIYDNLKDLLNQNPLNKANPLLN